MTQRLWCTRTILGISLTLAAFVAAQAAPPQAVIINTHTVFSTPSTGTFTATSPLCSSGTIRGTGFFVDNPAIHFTGRVEYVCDDNSGTFVLQYQPQLRKDPSFTLSGPWTIFPEGTGRYAHLSGHGDFGVVIDRSQDPPTGQETFVGFVQLQ